jgi:hypothetical protein
MKPPIDLAYFGQITPGFVGAAEFLVTDVEQLCDIDGDGNTDIEPIAPSVVVVNYGYEAELPINPRAAAPQTTEGDLTRVYEGIPFWYRDSPCIVTVSGHVIDEVTLEPIMDAEFMWDGDEVCAEWDWVWDPILDEFVEVCVATVRTDSTGWYEFSVESTNWGLCSTMEVLKTGYVNWMDDFCYVCDDLVINPELDPVCEFVTVSGTVEDKMTGLPLAGATIWANGEISDTSEISGTVAIYELVVPFDPDNPIVVTAGAVGYNPAADSVTIPECGGEAMISFQLHQTPHSRVLLYYGNGGLGEGQMGIAHNELAAMYEDLGFIVDYTDDWPDEFDWTLKYELIVLLGPGHDSGEDPLVDNFTIGQKADLDEYLQQHGKLVILSDSTAWTGHEVENDLLNWLPVDLNFGDPAFANAFISGHGDQVTAHCLTTNVATYSAIDAGDDWTDVWSPAGTASYPPSADGVLIRQNPGSGQGPLEEMYMVDIPSHGNGWVAILGDIDGLADAAEDAPDPPNWNYPADNEWVALNWLMCPAP